MPIALIPLNSYLLLRSQNEMRGRIKVTAERKIKRLGKKAKISVLGEWHTFVLATLGSLLYAFGVAQFTIPYHFPDTGMMGFAVILKYTIGLSPSLFNLAANVILLIWGWKALSKRFVMWTVYSVLLIAFTLEVFMRIELPMINDMFLVAIAGGLLKGIGMGLVFRCGVSMGGIDVIIAVVRKKFGIEVGQISFGINTFILLASVGIVGLERMLFGFVASFTVGQSADAILLSFDKRKLVFIVSDKADEIAEYIGENLRRGATMLYSKGCYSGEEHNTLMCLVTPRQTMELKRHLAHHFPRAFMVITEASEVVGKGFKHWKKAL